MLLGTGFHSQLNHQLFGTILAASGCILPLDLVWHIAS